MTTSGPRYDDLAALYINCTLKPSPELSQTQGLIDASAGWSPGTKTASSTAR